MNRWAVLLEKQSKDGDTKTRWCIAGARKHDLKYIEATCNIKGDHFGVTKNGGPVAFIAQAIVIWETAEDKLDAETRVIIEKWANGDFVIDASTA
jgi:hypothetical protein